MHAPGQDDRQLSLDLKGGYAMGTARRLRRTGKRMHLQKAFFAILPEPDERELIGPVLRRHCDAANIFSGRRPDRIWHISLAGVAQADTIPDEVFEQAAALAGRVAMPAFDVAFDRLTSFGMGAGVRPLVIEGGEGLDGVRLLQGRLIDAVFRTESSAKPFNPHLTLAYSRTHVTPTPIPPVRWRARSFVLVQSFVGQTRYAIRGQWPLSG